MTQRRVTYHLAIVLAAGVAIVLSWQPQLAFAQSLGKPPETFFANAQTLGRDASASAMVTVHIERYSTDRDLMAMQEALRTGGYPEFLPRLRQAPDVGYVEMNGRKVTVRWARQLAAGNGRTISIVADSPLAFVGGGSVDAKPRAGYELTVIRLDVDTIGLGSGVLAAAARVKPGGSAGVEIDDYAETPVKLATVRKSHKP